LDAHANAVKLRIGGAEKKSLKALYFQGSKGRFWLDTQGRLCFNHHHFGHLCAKKLVL